MESAESDNFQAGGDIINVNVTGNKNVIGKDVYVSQANNDIKQIGLNEHDLLKLDSEYANAFKQVIEFLNRLIIRSTEVRPEQITNIQHSIEDLVRETEGLKPHQQLSEAKEKGWTEKLKVVVKYVFKTFPALAASGALLHPVTAPFSPLIGIGLQSVIDGVKAGSEKS